MSRPRSRRWSACRAPNWRRSSPLVGVPERARKMRAQQIWHWLYVRGARQFDAMTSVSKDLRARARCSISRSIAPRSSPSRFPSTARANGCCSFPAKSRRAAASGRMRLHPGDRSRHALRLEPSRLHAQLLVLPYRHAAAGAQSHARRDRRPDHDRARPARTISSPPRPCRPIRRASSPTS